MELSSEREDVHIQFIFTELYLHSVQRLSGQPGVFVKPCLQESSLPLICTKLMSLAAGCGESLR